MHNGALMSYLIYKTLKIVTIVIYCLFILKLQEEI